MAGNPSPTTVATDLTSFRSSMPSLSPVDALVSSLTATETTLYDATTGFPQADTTAYLNWLGVVRRVQGV